MVVSQTASVPLQPEPVHAHRVNHSPTAKRNEVLVAITTQGRRRSCGYSAAEAEGHPIVNHPVATPQFSHKRDSLKHCLTGQASGSPIRPQARHQGLATPESDTVSAVQTGIAAEETPPLGTGIPGCEDHYVPKEKPVALDRATALSPDK